MNRRLERAALELFIPLYNSETGQGFRLARLHQEPNDHLTRCWKVPIVANWVWRSRTLVTTMSAASTLQALRTNSRFFSIGCLGGR